MKFDKFKQSKVTSVKCNQPPGGSSKFSLGYDDNYYSNISKKNENKNNIGVMYNISLLNDLKIKPQSKEVKIQEKEKPLSTNHFSSQNCKQIVKTPNNIVDYRNVYKPCSDKIVNKTSVKVSNAPGGKSKISLGYHESSLNR